MSKFITIATHNGIFHADEVVACAIARVALCYGVTGDEPEPDVEFVRTRNPEVLANCDYFFDVGGVYDPEQGRFDHHQRGGAGERPNGIPYASAGLAWKQFGRVWGYKLTQLYPGLGSMIAEFCDRFDQKVIMGIDALDCGAAKGGEWISSSGENIPMITLSGVISTLNPDDAALSDAAFLKAVDMVETILWSLVCREAKALAAMTKVKALDTGSPVLVMNEFLPWGEAVAEMSHVLYVVFPAPAGNQWNCQAVPPATGGFGQKKPLPAEWAGLQADSLAKVSGVADAIFCHNGRFICGAKSREGAIQLAKLAVLADGE